jgi:DNA-binding NarL/FixJ family response regulator
MPGLNGADATRQILAQRPDAKIIALSSHADRRFVAAMLQAGASGYVLKECASDEILRAISDVTQNRKFLSTGVAGLVIEGYLDQSTLRRSSPLAPREREVLQLLAEGQTSKQIAKALHISPKTVEVHRRNLMAKLKLHSIAELTKYAVREGLTPPS